MGWLQIGVSWLLPYAHSRSPKLNFYKLPVSSPSTVTRDVLVPKQLLLDASETAPPLSPAPDSVSAGKAQWPSLWPDQVCRMGAPPSWL